jgi:TolB-like protein/DNA-binding winged helix-turn-helix (wHTH) protein/Tfp pilus assembly protein PilF
MREVAPAHELVRFGPFEVDLRNRRVRKHGIKIRLQDQPFHILQILLEHSGELVSREELQRQIWPADTFVDFEKGLNNAIMKLRDALGDSSETPQFVETIPKHGYRFVAQIQATGNNGSVETAERSSAHMTLGSAGLGRRTIASSLETISEYRSARRVWMAIAATLAIGAVALVLEQLNVVKVPGLHERVFGASREPGIHSLAVIPLANLSNDPNQEYFADGMTDALITDLAQIGSVKVISRTSSMQYKQTKKSLPEIASELNVDGIVEGTVQRAGDHVRITAQLIHGASDKHIWAKSYERDVRDVFALERDVTEDIARQVQARLTTPNQGAVAQFRQANPKALDPYLQGNFHLNRYGKGAGDEEKRKAAEYFQQAIDADPQFASAYNGLANAHLGLFWPSKQDAQIANEAAERAVALDPNYSDAHLTLGAVEERAWNWTGAEREYRRAVALNPMSAHAHGNLGTILDLTGRLDEGWREQQIAFELDPNNADLFNYTLSCGLELRGQYDRAIAIYQMFLKRDPDNGYTHLGIARDYLKKEMYKEAMPHLEQFWALFGFSDVSVKAHRALATSSYRGAILESAKALEHLMATHQAFGPVTTAEFYATVGDKERAFYWLEQAFALHDTDIASTDDPLGWISEDQLLEPLRSDPRFKDLLRRMGLPELHINESRASGRENGQN